MSIGTARTPVPGPTSRPWRLAGLLIAASLLLTGCGGGEPPAGPDPTTDAPAPTSETSARAQLAALAAAAKDRKLSAVYTLSTDGRPTRSVTVTLAVDGSWRVDIPGGARGGTADVSIARNADGLYQCALASTNQLVAPACIRVAVPDGPLPADFDPRVQHLFTDWIDVLTDQHAPLAISTARQLPGATGTCFTVETTSASLAAPLEVGIYCFDADGTLTAARVAFGTVLLAGAPAPAPPTITLPGPVVTGQPLTMATPPPAVTDAPSGGSAPMA